ncbi:hypothetical protein HA402_010351 [Bradysia odoriphaga]|nr:hypothetical protein HA402_010351 [Bradysia odoriphaga]
MNRAILLVLVLACVSRVQPHGHVSFPLARTSIFRDPSFGAQQPFWWDDTGIVCGHAAQDLQYSTCGRCGDRLGETHAQQGGRYDKGIITATFTAGQIIPAIVDINANHRGHVTFELCPQVTETDTCFQILRIVGGDRRIFNNNTMMCTGEMNQNGRFNVHVQLPPNVRCTRCTLRWTYRTSYSPYPDPCLNPNPTQTFRNCVDIRIN